MAAELTTQDVLHNGPTGNFFKHPMRVVSINLHKDQVFAVQLRRKHAKKENQSKTYFKAPEVLSYSSILDHLNNGRLVKSVYEDREILLLTDADLCRTSTNKRSEEHIKKMLADRDSRWDLLLPILTGQSDAGRIRSFDEIYNDRGTSILINQRAKEKGVAPSTIYSLLHQYWAQGSRKNSLCTNLWRCGNPGQPKSQVTKLGRRSRLYVYGMSGPGAVLSEDDKKKIAQGYRLIKHDVSCHDAYLITSSVFWADRTISEDGKPKSNLWAQDRRPTEAQFMYWGKQLNDERPVSALRMGLRKWHQKKATRGGSLQEQVSRVAQLAYFDGTSTDVYLTSIRSRLVPLPPMTRLVLCEARSEMIYGIYCGWDAPSPRTALLTILNGAESKVDFCRRFDIEITDDDWPSFLSSMHHADNGELKAKSITEAEEQFGFSVEYSPARDSEKNGGAETQHHAIHKRLDHKIPGSTKGKRRERGEVAPVTQALWNYHEYMHELIQEILDYNNQEVLNLAPIEMLRERPDLAPTRLNIFRWFRDKGLSSAIEVDTKALRGFLLKDQQAIARKNGIYLMAEIHARLQIVPKLRYSSQSPVLLQTLSRIKLTGRDERTVIKLDENDLSVAWLPTRRGLIRLDLQSNDRLLKRRMSLTEWCAWLQGIALDKDRRRGTREQTQLEKLLRRQQTSEAARREERVERKKLPKKLSKAQQKAGLKGSLKHELELVRGYEENLRHQEASEERETNEVTPTTMVPSVLNLSSVSSAAERAMSKFHRGDNADPPACV